MKNNYSEKEINIFNGVLRLAKSGVDLSKITAQQIADSAGVGKATIYDYFSSKEEIVQGALLYSISAEAARFASAMDATPDFKQKMLLIYSGIISHTADTGSVFSLILDSGTPPKSDRDAMEKMSAPLKELVQQFISILHDVLADGHAQGELAMDINNPQQKDYVAMVLFGSLSAAAHMRHSCTEPTRRQIVENAYKMLVKAMN